MKNNPLVSIIVPIYNTEKYLSRCLSSIVKQTYPHLEIILVNDGSPDNSPQICKEWEKRDNRIKVIHKKNEGLGLARNSGLSIATGKYIAFIDSDDYIDHHMYETLISQAECENADIVYCGYYQENQSGIFIKKSDFSTLTVFEKKDLLELSTQYIPGVSKNLLTMSVWHSIYKREVITDFFFSERDVVSEDLHFQLSAILNSERIVYIPNALYYYCYNNTSLSHTFKFDKFIKYKNLSEHLFNLYKPYNKESIAYYFYFNIAIWMLRQINENSQIKNNEKKIFYKEIVNDSIWKRISPYINILELKKHFKLLYFILKYNNYYLLRAYMVLDYFIVHKSLKFKI